jgi:uncharacterized protein (TIGR02145 family)
LSYHQRFKQLSIYPFILIGLFILFANSCSNNNENNSNSPPVSSVKDIDGNVYHYTNIGTQVWMVENLKVTHYRNGDQILKVIADSLWQNLTKGSYIDFNNAAENGITYGHLYNFYAVSDLRSICPAGWHVPTDHEWNVLINNLGGDSIAGRKLKEKGTIHWDGPNSGVTNVTGFTALPGGYRSDSGLFLNLRKMGYWWSSSPDDSSGGWIRIMNHIDNGVSRTNNFKTYGFSVRCIKDQ